MIGKAFPGGGQRDAGSLVRNDILVGGVAIAASILFVENGSRAMVEAAQSIFHAGGGSDRVATVALFLNIALILFAWRRYKDVQLVRQLQHEAEQRAETLDTRDPLTGLLRRKSMLERTDALIADAAARGSSVAMMIIDIDRFKAVNDVHGQRAGDTLLKAVGGMLLEMAPSDSLCARTGGNEYAIAFPFVDQEKPAIGDLAEAILERICEPFDLAGATGHVTATVGIASLAADCSRAEHLLRRAAIAVGAARKVSRGRLLWFDRGMENLLRARNEVEAGLRGGISLGEFVPYYLAQIDLTSGRIEGFEVLARWRHPAGGIAEPDLFVSVAEETGLIGDLFESVFSQAIKDALQWDSSLALSVNISPAQLKDPILAPKLLKLLSECGFPAQRLEVEITEAALFENLEIAQPVVASLKNQGIRLALDDFGTGYSSLAHLRALPFDRIKIDRIFVQAMRSDRESAAIVRAVAAMADSLGVSATAVGVEDPETEAALREVGCDRAQGWLYGRPLSGDQVFELLKKNDLLSQAGLWSAAARRPANVAALRMGTAES